MKKSFERVDRGVDPYNLGINIINPIIALAIATISTAPADTSFAIFAFSFFSGIAMSTVCSIAVLNISADITIPNNIIHIIHSVLLIFSIIPAIITSIIIIKCIFIFCSFFSHVMIPSNEYLKL